MEIKKDIGKAFREKLDNLERLPGDALWDTISKDLDKKKKKQFPYFWLYIYSLPAIVFMLFILYDLNPDYTVAAKKQDSTQMDAPAHNTASAPKENTLINYRRLKDSSARRIANSKNKVNVSTGKDTINSHLTNKNTPTGNTAAKENGNAEGKKKNNGKSGLVTIKSHNALKNKANTANGVNNQKNTQHLAVKTERYAKTLKRRNKAIKHSASLPGLQKGSVLASGEDNTKSGNLVNGSDNDKLLNEIKQNIKGNSHGNTNSQNSGVTANSKDTASEIITFRKTSLSVNDSLAATIPVVKDSLKTEIPKELLAEEKKKKDSLIPKIIKRFSFFAYGGPSFFSFPERKIVTDSTTSNITTKSATRFGVLFGYRLNSKLSIRTGLSFYKLKQSAANIKLNYTMATNELLPPEDFRWIDYNYPYGFNNSLIISTLGSNYQALINIDRELSYFELPLEINYTLLDNKFGINLTGGGSLLLLTKNEVFAFNENGKMYLGTWNAAAKTSFTGSFGVGLHYNLSPSLQLNAESLFNYYLDTYTDTKPYSLNIRLGMQYNFDIVSPKK